MTTPVWLTDVFAAAVLGVAAFCAGRLVVARWTRRPVEVDSDAGHVLMGTAMAGMLVTGLRVASASGWIVVFGACMVWFSWRLVRSRRATISNPWLCPEPGPHLVESGAMVLMLLAVPVAPSGSHPADGMNGMNMSAGGSHLSFLSLLLAVFMVGYVVWLADRFPLRAPATTSPAISCASTLAPCCAMICKIAMGVTMAYMLVLML